MSEPSNHFDGLYTNWLRARAECVHPPETDDGEGEEIRAKIEARDEAARQLLVTPAPYPDHVWWKWESSRLSRERRRDRRGAYRSSRGRRSGARQSRHHPVRNRQARGVTE